MTERSSKSAEVLNRRVYLAMSRLNGNLVRAITDLLRSNEPIDPVVRNAIADAFEGKNPDRHVTFEVANKKDGPLGDVGERRLKFQRDMEIGRFVEDLRGTPQRLTLEKAERAAADRFGIG